MKIIKTFQYMVLVATIAILACVASPAATTFYVSGRTLYDANGNVFVPEGVANPDIWFISPALSCIPTCASKGANLIRIVWDTSGDASDLQNAIAATVNNDMVPNVELHDWTGDDNSNDLIEAANYYTSSSILPIILQYQKYMLLEIANEWSDGNESASSWSSAYEASITELRNAGITCPIVVDNPGYAQNYAAGVQYGQAIENYDPLHNVLFSVHMYASFNNSSAVTSCDSEYYNANLPLMIGEFGYDSDNGDNNLGDTENDSLVMQTAINDGYGYSAWSTYGNDEADAWLNLFESDWATTTWWGNEVFYNYSYSIANSAKHATVFGTAPAFTATATASPSTVAVNSPVTITVTAKDTGGAVNGAIVNMQIYNGSTSVNQQYNTGLSFSAGQTETFTYTYTPTSSGTFSVAAAVYGSGWAPNYVWNGAAATITASSSPPSFTGTASVSPSTVTVNSATTVTVTVKDTGGPITNAVVDMQVYNGTTSVNQQYNTGLTFAAGQTETFTYTWTPTAAGTYSVAVGAYGNGWTPNYVWNDPAATITVNNPPAFTATASVSPSTVGVGTASTITVKVTDTGGPISNAIVNMQVYSGSTSVNQQYNTGLTFAAGQTETFTYTWTPTSTGTYTVAAGAYGSGWTPNYVWTNPAATITATPADSAEYNFESSTQGWTYSGSPITGVSTSTAKQFAGSQSLAVTFNGASGTATAMVASPSTAAGKTVTFHVWIPTGSQISGIQPYVIQPSGGNYTWTGTYESVSQLTAGAWNTVTVTVPSNAVTPLYQLGVQFVTSGSWSGTCYIDSVSW
jgi:mannan endo-1,4-beta-mannosidase